MRSPAITLIRFLRYSIAALLITLAGNCGIVNAQQKTAPAQEKPKIRAITAFINLDRTQYQQQVADALKMLRRAQTVFESRGYQVQTIRIATLGDFRLNRPVGELAEWIPKLRRFSLDAALDT